MILNNYLKDKQFKKIELIVQSTCQNNCEYCYLKKYGNDLYPEEKRVDKETTLNNLRHLLNLIYKEQILGNNKIELFELFGGDIFQNNFYFELLKVFDEYHEYLNGVTIIAPTHYLDADILKIFKMERQLFANYHCRLELSYSIDNPNLDNNFQTYAQLNIGCHALIDPSNIDQWINYYKQWHKIYKKNYHQSILPSILETRDNNWTDEQLNKYTNLLIYMVWDRFKMCHFSAKELAKHLWAKNTKLPPIIGSDPIAINNGPMTKMPCQIQDILYIELNDLDIVPCHRTAYQELHIGNINKEIIEKSLEIGLDLWEMNTSHLPKCSHCDFTNVCLHQCFGASYETYGEMFVPVSNTCKMQQTKIITLYQIYKKLGVIKAAKKMNLLSNELLKLFDYLDSIVVFKKII